MANLITNISKHSFYVIEWTHDDVMGSCFPTQITFEFCKLHQSETILIDYYNYKCVLKYIVVK